MRVLRVILGTLILPTAAAAEPAAGSPPGLQACALIAADAARLACYDRLAGREASAAVTVPAAPASPASSAPAPAPAAASVTAAAPAAAPAPPKESFGLYAAEHPAPPPAPKAMEARVVALGTGANGQMTVTLEGGQLWELLDPDPLLAVGDTVTITRASLGSFMLQTPTRRLHRARRLR
jgi:hypothetical protein